METMSDIQFVRFVCLGYGTVCGLLAVTACAAWLCLSMVEWFDRLRARREHKRMMRDRFGVK